MTQNHQANPTPPVQPADLDVTQLTPAPLQMEGEFIFHAPATTVFDAVTDPQNIASWFPTLYDGSTDHSRSENAGNWGAGSKRYCQTRLMGTLNETILHWDYPRAYAYNVKNWTMPIKDHCAVMLVEPLGPSQSRFIWRQYYTPIGLFLKYAFPGMMISMMNRGMADLQQQLGGPGGQMRQVR
ncbi:MAG: SRPBCC family protein [Elainellaceae cyanobacterium]